MENREIFTQHYTSPLGGILLAADECGLTGLWFDGQKYFGGHLPAAHTERQTPILAQTKRWLDLYFAGKKPDFLPLLHPDGSAFRQAVWALLLQIPYGQTTTYGALAKQLAAKLGRPRMSAQAVGGAVGHNEISILIPCHRAVLTKRCGSWSWSGPICAGFLSPNGGWRCDGGLGARKMT